MVTVYFNKRRYEPRGPVRLPGGTVQGDVLEGRKTLGQALRENDALARRDVGSDRRGEVRGADRVRR
jgi:hypothetical protein